MADKIKVNRSTMCNCCKGANQRELLRVGDESRHDPNYSIAVCPVCDVADVPKETS